MGIEGDAHVQSHKRKFNSLFKEWHELNLEYCSAWTSEGKAWDLPYFYNERASVSMLAGAAWRAKWLALEEYRTDKVEKISAGSKQSRLRNFAGRADLYLSSPVTKGGRGVDHICEAKMGWYSLSHSQKSFGQRISELKQAALDSSRKNYCSSSWRRTAIVFLVPYFSESKSLDSIPTDWQHKLLKDVKQSGSFAWVWSSPPIARESRFDWEGEDRVHLYPGVFMLFFNK